MWQIILPWLCENLKASGCVEPFAGGCSSIADGKWLDRSDNFVEWLKADPLFRGLLESSMDTSRSTKINGGESLRYYLYRAAAAAYADATPPVLAKGGLFKNVGLYAKDGSGFWNKHVNNPSIVPFEKFKSTGGMMLIHAKVSEYEGSEEGVWGKLSSPPTMLLSSHAPVEQAGTPLRGEQQWPDVGEALRQAFTGKMTAAQKEVLLGTPFSELLGPLLSSVTVVEVRKGKGARWPPRQGALGRRLWVVGVGGCGVEATNAALCVAGMGEGAEREKDAPCISIVSKHA